MQGMAQQITPKDVAGDKEYNRVCREYELKGGDSMELLQAYLDKYPDSRHKNRVLSLIASAEMGFHHTYCCGLLVSFFIVKISYKYFFPF